MTDTVILEELATDIRAQLTAINDKVSEQTSDAKLTQLVKEALAGLTDDEARKLKFGGGDQDRKLVGTKYARYGLSLADVEFLFDLQTSLTGQPKRGGGVYGGPSEAL